MAWVIIGLVLGGALFTLVKVSKALGASEQKEEFLEEDRELQGRVDEILAASTSTADRVARGRARRLRAHGEDEDPPVPDTAA